MRNTTPIVPVTLGQTVRVYGYSFIVADIWTGSLSNGKRVYRFRGFCTPEPCNDPIRHLGYNGGVYGGLLLDPSAPPISLRDDRGPENSI